MTFGLYIVWLPWMSGSSWLSCLQPVYSSSCLKPASVQMFMSRGLGCLQLVSRGSGQCLAYPRTIDREYFLSLVRCIYIYIIFPLQACVLFNIAALHSQIAAHQVSRYTLCAPVDGSHCVNSFCVCWQDRSTPKGIDTTIKNLEKAIGRCIVDGVVEWGLPHIESLSHHIELIIHSRWRPFLGNPLFRAFIFPIWYLLLMVWMQGCPSLYHSYTLDQLPTLASGR